MCLMKTFFFGLGIFCPNSNGVEEGNPCNLTDGLFIKNLETFPDTKLNLFPRLVTVTSVFQYP